MAIIQNIDINHKDAYFLNMELIIEENIYGTIPGNIKNTIIIFILTILQLMATEMKMSNNKIILILN